MKYINIYIVWINNLKGANLPKEEPVRVCHTNFEENCFERDMKVFFFSLLKKFSHQLKKKFISRENVSRFYH